MAETRTDRFRDRRLLLYVAMGVVAGAVYVLFDLVSEWRIEQGTLQGTLAEIHAVVDHVLPVIAGGLFGTALHHLRIRREIAAARDVARGAEALRERLHRVERDQAVWVLAAAVLHELNNPLHALGLMLDELTLETDPAAARELVSRCRHQTERSLRQLETLRRMRSLAEPELARVSLDVLVRSLARDLEPLAREDGCGIRVECEGPVEANADASYVRTILENLLDNSLHSVRDRGHGCITIRLGVKDARAIVSVLDDGPPLAVSAHSGLFEPLRSTKTAGLGLGLPIARALARSMRGELSLDDAANKAFRLDLPLARTS
jgi:two-component system, LuxR family, sensor kinase FixL